MIGFRPPRIVRLFLAALLVSAPLIGCTNDSLQPINTQTNNLLDNRLDLSGTICTSPPEDTAFPVKVMFIVDTSGSMQFTDPSDATAGSCQASCAEKVSGLNASQCATLCAGAENPGRQAAVDKVLKRFGANPAVSFSLIRFNSRIVVNGSEGSDFGGFRRASELQEALRGFSNADILTDYQGALSTAYAELQKDMIGTDPVALARTKYVIIFLSDGAPSPRCEAGCDDTDTQTITGVVVDSWCDLPRDQWCSRPGVDQNGRPVDIVVENEFCDSLLKSFPALKEPCQAYNTDSDILQKVREIVDLGQQFGAGELRFHTAFLFVDGLPQVVLDIFDVDKVRSETLLKAMAAEGEGLYRSFNSGQAIDFLNINYASIPRRFSMTGFLASNLNVRPGIDRLLTDSDGDGLDDSTEFEAGLLRGDPDSDADGYNDKLEYDRRNQGFDPNDATKPARICSRSDRIDRDGDGLNRCEEAILGSDPNLADSDRDRLPDGLEFFAGSDPAAADDSLDRDNDDQTTARELEIHADPTLADRAIHENFAYETRTTLLPPRADLRKCWDFSIERIRLATTEQKSRAGTLGYNEILVYLGEGPENDALDFGTFRAACVRVQYVEHACDDGQGGSSSSLTCGFKDPASGNIELSDDDFLDIGELSNRRRTSIDNKAADPCVGVSPL